MLSHFSLVQLLATLWTLARQAPLSMEYSRQEYWNGLPFPPPEDLPDPGVQPTLFFVSRIGRQVLYHQRHLGSTGCHQKPSHKPLGHLTLKTPQLAVGTPISHALHPLIPHPCSLCSFPVAARGSFGQRLVSKQRKPAPNCRLGRDSKLELQPHPGKSKMEAASTHPGAL